MRTMAESFPDGCDLVYVGADPDLFVVEMRDSFGFDPSDHFYWERSGRFHCPAHALDELCDDFNSRWPVRPR